jgi:hypothetical protein
VALIYPPYAERQKKATLEKYPGLRLLVEKLERIISDNPSRGHEEMITLPAKGRIKVKTQSVKLSFFPEQYSIGYDCLSATYIQTDEDSLVITLRFRQTLDSKAFVSPQTLVRKAADS